MRPTRSYRQDESFHTLIFPTYETVLYIVNGNWDIYERLLYGSAGHLIHCVLLGVITVRSEDLGSEPP